jgi:hypothetical protein
VKGPSYSFFLTTLGSFNSNGNTLSSNFTLCDLGVELEFDTLLGKELLTLLCDISIHTWTTDLTKKLDDCNLST